MVHTVHKITSGKYFFSDQSKQPIRSQYLKLTNQMSGPNVPPPVSKVSFCRCAERCRGRSSSAARVQTVTSRQLRVRLAPAVSALRTEMRPRGDAFPPAVTALRSCITHRCLREFETK